MTLQVPLAWPRPHGLRVGKEEATPVRCSNVDHTGSQHQLICYSHVAHHQSCQAPGFCGAISGRVGNLGFRRILSSLLALPDGIHHVQPERFWPLCLFLSLKKHFQRPFSGASPGLDAEGTREGLNSAVLETYPGEALNRLPAER